ncbi:MAG: molybdenum cofactor biosynthesis protein MoaE [Planctomycetota bacterium]
MAEFRLTDEAIDVPALRREIELSGQGAIVTFEGVVRDTFEGRRVVRLEYEAYPPMATKQMDRLFCEVEERFGVERLLVVHRLGLVPEGEAAIAILAASPHRREAFGAAAYTIDRIKEILPVWKKEHYEDGEVWVESSGVRRATGPGDAPLDGAD